MWKLAILKTSMRRRRGRRGTTTQIKAESAITIPNSGTPNLPPKYLDSILASLSVKLTKKKPLFQDHSFIGCDVMQFGR